MASPTTNVNIPQVWKQPLLTELRKQVSREEIQVWESLETYLMNTRPINFFWPAKYDGLSNVYNTFAVFNSGLGGEQNLDLMKAPYDCTMHVFAHGMGSGTVAGSNAVLKVTDQSNVDITTNWGGGVNYFVYYHGVANANNAISVAGTQHYSTGQTIGYSLLFANTGVPAVHTGYVQVSVRIVPRRPSAIKPY
jgi:hypothetical protein